MLKGKKSIIVGMGIGQLYKNVLENLGAEVITVDPDPNKQAMYKTLEEAIIDHGGFNTGHICTPNYTHFELANQLADCSKIVFVDKPGCKNIEEWTALVFANPLTRIMMVKNNQWREKITGLRNLMDRAKSVNVNWINKDRIPNPGSWFTTKELAFGGVSRDLMPHLLSLFMVLEEDYNKATEISRTKEQRWSLEDLTGTDYGSVNPNGTYDVDDFCSISYEVNGRVWNLTADWRSNAENKQNIEFVMPGGQIVGYELGLCPEDAYQNMINDCINKFNDVAFWQKQVEQDLWIHHMVSK